MIIIKSKEDFTRILYSNGYTFADLARKIELNPSSLSNFLAGRSGISPQKAKSISITLKKNFDELFEIQINLKVVN